VRFNEKRLCLSRTFKAKVVVWVASSLFTAKFYIVRIVRAVGLGEGIDGVRIVDDVAKENGKDEECLHTLLADEGGIVLCGLYALNFQSGTVAAVAGLLASVILDDVRPDLLEDLRSGGLCRGDVLSSTAIDTNGRVSSWR
jgi:hypothetical protein